MFSTKSVQSLRKLFAGYHEPLPISKQQSQKLLDGIKASFRSQLDREYGRSSSDHTPAPTKSTGETSPQARRSAASLHLKSVLSNPLFSYNNKENTPPLAKGAMGARS
ncbi:uncharacterized protein TrAtP1_007754 [Trichoderma atroviride]|uniref:uncharacterized protein n=1 Tax=Hypocrea atroviridis TaxID=63577 RepID=UPI00331E21AF|nr:hypothetical protein TrAtP1_007754 [Trichoderma atroviride]